MTTKTSYGMLLGLCAISGFAGYTAVRSGEEKEVPAVGVTETAVVLPILPLAPEFEVVQIPPSEEEHIEIPLDKPAKPVILHKHSEKVRNAIKAIIPIARGARVVAVEYPPVQKTAPVSGIEVSPGSAKAADESETPRPTTTFCRKVGNPKLPATRKEICFERDDIYRKIVRTYEK